MKKENWKNSILTVSLLLVICLVQVQSKGKKDYIEKLDDIKDFKKLLRTRTSVLVLFSKSAKIDNSLYSEFVEAAETVKGKGTICVINCGDAPKLCKKWKASPNPLIIQHYKNGEFNKEYDRARVTRSIVNFMRDPTGDIPWAEEPAAADVLHVSSAKEFTKLITKSKKPVLAMFYAPWCGHCKKLKPEFSLAASDIKSSFTLASVDCDNPDLMALRQVYNITGYPTLFYFEEGKMKYKYGGEYNKDGLISWLENPSEPKEPEKEVPWSEKETDVVHLKSDNFEEFMSANPSVIVMFYAPWCGHCKAMKPAYEEAATQLIEENIAGKLVAIDTTISKDLGEKFGVKGFPTVKYFQNGEEKWAFNERTAEKIVDFMRDPQEPPPPPAPEPQWSEVESDVMHLTSDNFLSTVKRKKHALVMFYAPWCGHCKKAKPHFTEAAAKFADNPKVMFAAVDCTAHQDICSKYDVSGYPTIKYINYGKNEQPYSGGREEADFVAFMTDPENPKKAPPPAPEVDMWEGVLEAENVVRLTTADFDTFIAANPSVLVMFYAPWCGHCKNMKPDYALAAAALKEQNIVGVLAAVDATSEPAINSKYEVKGFPSLKYFKDGKYAFDFTQRTKDALISFMKSPAEPAAAPVVEDMWAGVPGVENVAQLTTKTFNKFVTDNPSVLVMFYAPWCGHCKQMKPAYAEAAAKAQAEGLVGKFAAVDCTAEKALATQFDVKGFPSLKYFKDGKDLMRYTSGRDVDSLMEFIKLPYIPEEVKKDEL